MNLREYEWFNNPRGLCGNGPYRPFLLERYTRPQMGWASIAAGGDEYVAAAAQLVKNGCMPIVRLYRSAMGAMAVPGDWYSIYQAYLDAGCRWFELYHEPNRPENWPRLPDGRPQVAVDWQNADGCIAPLMEHWLDWAERVIEMGGYPAFPALAESVDLLSAAVYWQDAMLRYLKDAHHDRFLRVVGSGLWCATHPYLLNHYYQEPPGGPRHVARPYAQQRSDQAGWHFEYPYDPLLQAQDPGRTVFGATAEAPYGSPDGLVAAGEAFQQLLNHHFNAGPVPVIGTAGGIAPIPRPTEPPYQPDDRYPPYSHESHAEATLAMWRWIVDYGPPWFFGLTLSDEAEYYEKQGVVLAIHRMIATPPLMKEVLSIETGGAYTGPPVEAYTAPPPQETRASELVIDVPPAVEPQQAPERASSSRPFEQIAPDEDDLPAFLRDFSGADDLSEQALEDWLSETGGPFTASQEALPPTPSILEEAVPAWFEEEGPPAASEAPPSPTEEESAAVDELPIWLADLERTPEEIPGAPAPAAEPSPEEEVPGWLADMLGSAGTPEQVSGSPREAAAPEALIPDIAIPEIPVPQITIPPITIPEIASAETPAAIETPAEAAEEVPDWLAELGLGTEQAEAVPGAPDEWFEELAEAEPELPAAIETPPAVPGQEAAIPEWLAPDDLAAAVPTPAGAPEPSASQPDDEEGGVPEWLADLGLAPAEEPAPLVTIPPASPVVIDEPSAEVTAPAVEAAAPDAEIKAAPLATPSGEPDFHLLIMAIPGLDPEWFFDAALRYWDAFRPVLITEWAQVGLVPAGKRAAVTVLVSAAMASMVEAQLRQAALTVEVDLVVVDTLDDLRMELDWRASTGKRFG